jgi:hypothetical protein
MTKTNDGEYFDGTAVSIYEGAFAGSFDLPEELGVKMRFNDVVVFMVTATVDQSKVVATKSGDLKRSNRLNIIAVRDIDPQAARAIDNVLNGPAQGTIV